jgi:hypothetical protein
METASAFSGALHSRGRHVAVACPGMRRVSRIRLAAVLASGLALVLPAGCDDSARTSVLTPGAGAGASEDGAPEERSFSESAGVQRPEPRGGVIERPANAGAWDPMIAEEGAPFFPSRIAVEAAELPPDAFTSSESCRECHAEIYAQWSRSIMSHSWEDPIYRAILKRASVATGGAIDRFCIGCHSPIGLITGTADAQESTTPAPGVDCETCHTVCRVTGLGNGSLVLAPFTERRPLRFGPRDDALSPFHDTTYSPLHARSEFCAPCHNVTHPFNRLAIERTYDEWRDSYYHGAGITCQSCHMVPGPGQPRSAGKSTPDGKVRPDLAAHTFIGANVTLHRYFGEEEQAQAAIGLLRSAATIRFLDAPAGARPGDDVSVQVRVENVGAGHKLPTGFPEGREVWIDFKVEDEQGREIHRLGALKDGHTEKGTRSFKAILGDPSGQVVDVNVWEADRLLSDTRILPKGFADAEYTFRVPAGVEGDLTLIADLNYMSFPPYILDEILGPGRIESHIVLMASARHRVKTVGGGG